MSNKIVIIDHHNGDAKVLKTYNSRVVHVHASIIEITNCCWFLRQIKERKLVEFSKNVVTEYILEKDKDKKGCVLENLDRYSCAVCTTKTVKL